MHSVQAACDHFGDARMGSASNAHNVCVSRNKGVATMYQYLFSHILFIDNDVTIPPDAIEKLVALDANVATGCVPTTVGDQPFIAVAQSVVRATMAITWRTRWFSGVQETEICGGACLLVRREVFGKVGFPWFRWPEFYTNNHYSFHSEDVDFCNRVLAAGLGPIMAHGDVRCGHSRVVDAASLIEEEHG